MSLFTLGEFFQKRDPFKTRKKAIQNCLDRTTDENRRASLQHALHRFAREESNRHLAEFLTSGFINGHRTDYD
jgi:hypothetical protein